MVQRLIPDTGREALSLHIQRVRLDFGLLLREDCLALVHWLFVHFVDHHEDLGGRRVLLEGLDAVFVVFECLWVLAVHVENVDQHMYISEQCVSVTVEILLHKLILSTTIPQSQA